MLSSIIKILPLCTEFNSLQENTIKSRALLRKRPEVKSERSENLKRKYHKNLILNLFQKFNLLHFVAKKAIFFLKVFMMIFLNILIFLI